MRAEKNYPSNKKMIVMGHSMGGCISRLLITDSGPRIWDQMFTVPPEQMDLTPEHKHIHHGVRHFQSPPGDRPRHLHFRSAPRGRQGGWLVGQPGSPAHQAAGRSC